MWTVTPLRVGEPLGFSEADGGEVDGVDVQALLS